MAIDKQFMEFVAEQLSGGGDISYRAMFGEYGIYCGNKFFAVVCDNKLYIKPTKAGREFIGNPEEQPPYPGAKNYFLVEDQIEDRDWLSELVQITANELPEPKPKRKK